MLLQLMDPSGKYLENYKFADGCQTLNTSAKAVYVIQLSDALITQLKIFKYSDGISQNFIPNLSIHKDISLRDNGMVLSGVIYHEGKQSHCGHYISEGNVDNMWFLISDTKILRYQKLQCNLMIPYILIYKKKSNFLVALPNSLNGTGRVSSTSELISQSEL